MVYAHAIQMLEREIANEQLAAALIVAFGGEAEPRTLVAAQREFDEWLVSEPVQGETSTTTADEWRQVMGLGAA